MLQPQLGLVRHHGVLCSPVIMEAGKQTHHDATHAVGSAIPCWPDSDVALLTFVCCLLYGGIRQSVTARTTGGGGWHSVETYGRATDNACGIRSAKNGTIADGTLKMEGMAAAERQQMTH